MERQTAETVENPQYDNKPNFNKLPAKSVSTTMTYAGIGSRQTPTEVLNRMTELAKELKSLGYTLNTGVTFRNKEEGADKAFSDGTTNKNLFSPENQGSREMEQSIAKEIHPNPKALSEGGLKLMARNTNQVFGDNLNTPVDFVIFWSKETSNPLRPEGGTGHAVEMARRKNIPTINLARDNWRSQLDIALNKSTTIDDASPFLSDLGIRKVQMIPTGFDYLLESTELMDKAQDDSVTVEQFSEILNNVRTIDQRVNEGIEQIESGSFDSVLESRGHSRNEIIGELRLARTHDDIGRILEKIC